MAVLSTPLLSIPLLFLSWNFEVHEQWSPIIPTSDSCTQVTVRIVGTTFSAATLKSCNWWGSGEIGASDTLDLKVG